jgi:cytochrome P450
MSYIVSSALAALLLYAIYILQRQHRQDGVLRSNSGRDITKHQPKEPFTGLDFQMCMHSDVPFLYRLHQRYGRNFQLSTLDSQRTMVTIAPENIQAINSGREWGIEPYRLPGMEYFCGRGFLTTDGDVWQHSRKTMKPIFAKNNLVDLGPLSREVEKLLLELPTDGSTVDLQPLFYTMVCPTSRANVFTYYSA